jgi:hypothetical protein
MVMFEPSPILSAAAIKALDPNNAAELFYEKLHKQIRKVEEGLQAGESIALTHASASGACVVDAIGYHGRDLIVLSGVDPQTRRCKPLVHFHAVNLTVTIVRDNARCRPIGFAGELEKEPETSTLPTGRDG